MEPKKVLEEIEASVGPQLTRAHLPPATVRRYLSGKGYQYKSQIASFQMLKGGVAKTTSCLNIGLRAAMWGCRVLFVDLDQQANLSFALGVEDENAPVWVDLLEKKSTLEQTLVSVDENIDLIPSSLNNSVLDRILLQGNRNWSQSVLAVLKPLQGQYDLILIDTAPNLSALNTSVTCASDLVVLPINPDKFSLIGLKKHLADLASLRSEFALNFQEKILFTKFDARESMSREILSTVADSYATQLMHHFVRTSSDIKNTIRSSRNLFSTKNNAKEDYDLVTKEFLDWI